MINAKHVITCLIVTFLIINAYIVYAKVIPIIVPIGKEYEMKPEDYAFYLLSQAYENEQNCTYYMKLAYNYIKAKILPDREFRRNVHYNILIISMIITFIFLISSFIAGMKKHDDAGAILFIAFICAGVFALSLGIGYIVIPNQVKIVKKCLEMLNVTYCNKQAILYYMKIFK